MSSTYAHYQGPASLPSDYAILSRLSRSPSGGDGDRVENDDEDDSNTSRRNGAFSPRRGSFPSSGFLRPPPTMAGYPVQSKSSSSSQTQITESTPLLNPPVPRIEEHTEDDALSNEGSSISMFWEELRILTKYALPVFGTHLLEYSLVMVSVISIGHLSTTALAAISLGSMTASVSGFSMIQGIASALDTMLPSAWTSPQPQLVGLWPMFLVWFNAESILLFLKQEPEVAHLAAVYLRWVSIGLPAYAFNCISRPVAVPTRIIFVIAPLNAILNYALVWGPQSIRLGFIGLPSQLRSRSISFQSCRLYMACLCAPDGMVSTLAADVYQPRRPRASGLAGIGQTASEWWAWELMGLAASLLGPVTLATQSVLLVSSSTSYQAPFALGVATSVRIGNLLGNQNARRAGMAANTAIIMALFISGISSIMFFVFRKNWGRLFNDDAGAYSYRFTPTLPCLAVFCRGCVACRVDPSWLPSSKCLTAMCCDCWYFRARGKQFTGALLNVSAYYVIGIPFGVWLGFSRHLGIHGLWIGLTVSLVYCAFFGTWLWYVRTGTARCGRSWNASRRRQGAPGGERHRERRKRIAWC
ncbi:hypothetical protein BD779DRAFT_1612809 [Infundibulicybe gibba]|nr:hypothetical protein BD779DRAFT_1612809 [Infundibulicybe gibba]